MCIFRTISEVSPSTVDRYVKYWEDIRPTTWHEKWKRWIFAFCSIRAGWKTNKNTYKALVNIPWTSPSELRELLEKCKIGIYDNRTKGIWDFTDDILYDPKVLDIDPSQDWVVQRDKLVKRFHGIGLAKVAFALEMCYPTECKVVCLDTHCLRMFGIDGKKGVTDSMYKACEKQWIKACETLGYPSPIVRHILWDKLQGKKNTRYWSHVLEKA